MDDLAGGAVEVPGPAVQVEEAADLNLRFDAYLEDDEAGLGKRGDPRQEVRFDPELGVVAVRSFGFTVTRSYTISVFRWPGQLMVTSRGRARGSSVAENL